MAMTKATMLTVVGHLADADVEDAAERPERSVSCPRMAASVSRIERSQLVRRGDLEIDGRVLDRGGALGDGTAAALGDGGGEAVGATVGGGSAPWWDSGWVMRRVSRRRR